MPVPPVVATAASTSPTRTAAIVDQASEAAELARRGTDVVLVVEPDGAYLPLPDRQPGRVAVLIGRLEDPVVGAAAEEMAAELFRPSP